MTMKILLPFVLSLVISTSTADRDTCKFGISEKSHQKYHGGKCYVFFFDLQERYTNAKEVCRKYGGHLAMPKTYVINDLLANELRLMDDYYRYWIGLNDIQYENKFQWEDGSYLHEYQFSRWGKDEGPRYGVFHHTEDCVGLDKNGFWHDFVCTYYFAEETLPFVCEFYVGRRTTATTKPPSTTQTSSVPTTNEATTTKPTTTTPTTTTTTPTTTPTTTTTTTTTTTPTTTTTTPTPTTTTPIPTTTTTTPTTTNTTPTTTTPTSTTTPSTPTTAAATTTPEPSTTACPNLNCDLECGLSGFKTSDNGCFLCECDE